MTTLVGFSGSTRRASYNSMLLEAAARLMPEGATLEIASIEEIPLYDGDREAGEGIPESVTKLKERIIEADGLLIATPEYNHSIPGVAKNAIDWLSRPPRDIPRVFGDLPVAVMGASPGRGGTAMAQAAWLPVLRTLGTRPWFGRMLLVAGAADLFDEDGLRDDQTLTRLEKFVTGFVEFVADEKRRAP
jgi:chromate reductase, NAD(P)H dehydrogenase (quinone)